MMSKQPLPAKARLGPDWLDRVIGGAALVLLALALTAIARGWMLHGAQWGAVPWPVWVHLVAAVIALALTPIVLWRRRGDALHRLLGRLWVGVMTITAGFSLFVQAIRPGHFTLIHLLSIYTLINLPLLVIAARQGQIARHRRIIRSMAIGALLIAGSFTFLFNRLLGHWLAGA